MTILLDLTPDLEARLRRRASREGEEEQTVALRLLAASLGNDESDDGGSPSPGSRSMADLFAGRVGLVSGSGEAYSEDGGSRFAEALARKHRR